MTESTKEKMLDLFATESMRMLVDRSGIGLNPQQVAEVAYMVAERMLEQREKILYQWKRKEDIRLNGIDNLELTIRSQNCLKAQDILTIQQLQLYTVNTLLKIPNLGRRSVNEIVEQMAAHGYELRSDK